MGQGTECPDRPTEVSVIRFVSRNRTIEEIAPKKEIFTCKQKGCGKIFTNQDEFKTHEALEELKIRFICREPGCGKELSDPGTMWRHYQEFHSNETNLYVCPYTSCGSLHGSSEHLEEHIENYHRQPPTLPTEPEIICFEGPITTPIEEEEEIIKSTAEDEEEEADDDEIIQTVEDDFFDHEKKTIRLIKGSRKISNYIITPKGSVQGIEGYNNEERLMQIENDNTITADARDIEDFTAPDYVKSSRITETSEEEYYINIYEDTPRAEVEEVIFETTEEKIQDHRIDLGNLESVFRSGLEGETKKIEANIESNGNCSDDEEYTPKKQRMSRYKQEQPYKCEINGCGKTYKYISHYRHHQDSHKIQDNNTLNKINKPINNRQSSKGKATTVSFFLCKIPGCGAQASNVTTLWKHYQDNHANSKANVNESTKNNQSFRCKIANCEMEYHTSAMLYKHLTQAHTDVTDTNDSSTNGKTGNGMIIRYTYDAVSQENLKTESKAKFDNANGYDDFHQSIVSNLLRFNDKSGK